MDTSFLISRTCFDLISDARLKQYFYLILNVCEVFPLKKKKAFQASNSTMFSSESPQYLRQGLSMFGQSLLLNVSDFFPL